MDRISPTRSSGRSVVERPLSVWDNITGGALIVVAALYIFLETVVRSRTHEPVEPEIVVLLVADLVVAGLILRSRYWWPPLLGAALLLIGMGGAIPHDLPSVINSSDPVHLVFSTLILVVPIIGAISAVQGIRLRLRSADTT